VYMSMPPGFGTKGETKVCRLTKGLLVKQFWQRQKNPIILFFQHSLTFNITSITFYYSSNKKITTK
jgi:hypothetical protein